MLAQVTDLARIAQHLHVLITVRPAGLGIHGRRRWLCSGDAFLETVVLGRDDNKVNMFMDLPRFLRGCGCFVPVMRDVG
ncbi:MAG: hypothetical protein L0H29_10085, partial [Sinobacteraceae bacterium]|nr:hypothetical protein [Nevskiaceae bacterium]